MTEPAPTYTSAAPYIEIHPHKCAGAPVFAGTRIHADMPARVLREGTSVDWIYHNYPGLTPAHIALSLWYAYRRWPKKDAKRLRKWLRALSVDELYALGVTSDGQLGIGWDVDLGGQ